jgi:hypothetical protein
MADLKIVPFPHTPLNDIPTKLRELADDLEKGVHGPVDQLLVVMPTDEDYPDVFGYGAIDGATIIMELELAKLTMLKTIVGEHG